MGNLRWIKLGLTTSSTNHWLFMGKLLKLRMPWLIHLWNQDNNTYPVRIKYHNKTKFQVLHLINSSNCQGNLIFWGGRVDFSGGDWRKCPFHISILNEGQGFQVTLFSYLLSVSLHQQLSRCDPHCLSFSARVIEHLPSPQPLSLCSPHWWLFPFSLQPSGLLE